MGGEGARFTVSFFNFANEWEECVQAGFCHESSLRPISTMPRAGQRGMVRPGAGRPYSPRAGPLLVTSMRRRDHAGGVFFRVSVVTASVVTGFKKGGGVVGGGTVKGCNDTKGDGLV